MENYPFSTELKCNLDWDMGERLSRLKGSFVYSSKCLMSHRIHTESATTKLIGEQQRNKEDYEMMCRFWPKWFAKRLSGIYATAEKSNQL